MIDVLRLGATTSAMSVDIAITERYTPTKPGTAVASFTTDEGDVLTFDGLQGFAEESPNRW